MYEHFKHEFLSSIGILFSAEKLKIISDSLDKIAVNYEVSKKCTEIAVCQFEIPELVRTYLVCKKIEGLADGTLYNYQTCLENFFLTVKKQPQDVTANDIRIYLYRYQSFKKISNRSLAKLRQTIAGFYLWAQTEEYILKNPTKNLHRIKFEEKPRQALTQIELEYVRRACKDSRELAMIETMYSTGCRVSELAGLKISDIDFDTKKVHLFGKGNKHRFSFLNAKAEVAIKQYISERESETDFLFVSERKPHWQLKKEAIEKIVRGISERANLNGKKLTPHVFRHTTATTAIRNGMPVESIQQILGHSKVDTTMIYAHADIGMAQSQHLKSVI